MLNKKRRILLVSFIILLSLNFILLTTKALTAKEEDAKQPPIFKQASASIAESLVEVENDLVGLVNSSIMRELIAGDNSKKDEVTNLFLDLSQRKSLYMQIRYIDQTGQEIIRIDNDDKQARVIPEGELQNKQERYYFTGTMALTEGQVYVSPLDFNVENGQLQNIGTKDYPRYVPVIRYASQVFDQDQNSQGIIILNIYINDFFIPFRRTLEQSKRAVFYLLRDSGDFLFHSQFSAQFGFKYESKIIDSSVFGDKPVTLFTNEQGEVERNGKRYQYKKIHPDQLNYDKRFWILVKEVETSAVEVVSFKSFIMNNFAYLIIILVVIIMLIVNYSGRWAKLTSKK